MTKWLLAIAFAAISFLGTAYYFQYKENTVLKLEALRNKTILAKMEQRVDKLETFLPDIGDFMRELQFEMAKLWYAEKFQNRGLALYEIKEMKESIDGIENLKPSVNGVDAAGVLQAVENTQIAGMEKAIKAKNHEKFLEEYQQTLLSCNECHMTVGKGFNRIGIPAAPPVSNQIWNP